LLFRNITKFESVNGKRPTSQETQTISNIIMVPNETKTKSVPILWITLPHNYCRRIICVDELYNNSVWATRSESQDYDGGGSIEVGQG
jgi:hypothetical protein